MLFKKLLILSLVSLLPFTPLNNSNNLYQGVKIPIPLNKTSDNISSKVYSILKDTKTPLESDIIHNINQKYGNDNIVKNGYKYFFKQLNGGGRHELSIPKNKVLKVDYYLLNDGGDLHLKIYDDDNNIIKTIDPNSKGTIEIKFHKPTHVHIDTIGKDTHCYVNVKWNIKK
ncbi:hypothetical protein [Dethiothermospora halolimnae]|uniref:hypothetical protein n=1 Tax=Dethiothermospora halolimnae TaxID=3114390 RepID=UPI003CCBEC8E